MEEVNNLLLTIVKGIVQFPEDVELHSTETEDEKGTQTMINVKVNRKDVGLCIGEGGKNAEAIRKVIAMYAWKQTERRVYTRIDAPRIPKQHFNFEE